MPAITLTSPLGLPPSRPKTVSEVRSNGVAIVKSSNEDALLAVRSVNSWDVTKVPVWPEDWSTMTARLKREQSHCCGEKECVSHVVYPCRPTSLELQNLFVEGT